MEKVGVLVVSKCLSAAAMVDTIGRSQKYRPEFYIVEKQPNPFNYSRAKAHSIVPDLNPEAVAGFARKYRNEIAFGLVDTEDFIVAGGRDIVEREAGVQMICVSKKYAVERSKAEQRVLFDRTFKEANPRHRVFDPKDYPDTEGAVAELKKTVADIGEPVVKPDAPARGAGVGVWGSDFRTEEEMVAFFLNVLSKGRVVVEEKVEGEESSFQAFSDGRHFVPAPLTRDYKRGFDCNEGKLTGGMGSYRGRSNRLPFLRESEWEALVRAEEAAFRRWKGKGSNPGLRGIVLYDAIMHTGKGLKVLERNSRGGNTEVINVLTTVADDFVDVCYRMLEGSLKGIRFRREASVVTCAVPQAYGTGRPSADGGTVDLTRADELAERSGGAVRIFPMDLQLKDGVTLAGTSRSVAVAGLAPSTDEARRLSLRGVQAIAGPLRWRGDIASSSDISRCSAHLTRLRRDAG